MKPKRITRPGLARDAADRWKKQYLWGSNRPADKLAIHERIVALGADPDPDDVDKAIGNGSWTSVPRCDGCGKDDEQPRVRVGEEPNYESSTAVLCTECLQEALALVVRCTEGEPDGRK